MILKYPLGLLALLGIPVLILIYIIKSKYTEQILPSTYLWRLSDKFLKKKKNKKRISGIVSLILQICIIIAISLIIAHPVFTLPNGANEYLFIIDSSGSMNMERDGKTRLQYGKDKIHSIIDSSASGSLYTIMVLKDKPEVILEQNSDKNKTIEFLNGITPSDISVNTSDSIAYAQYYFNRNNSLRSYLVTDKEIKANDALKVIDTSSNEENYALMDTKITLVGDEFPSLLVSGKAYSYISDANLTLSLSIDGKEEVRKELSVKKGEACLFKFQTPKTKYLNLKLEILNKDGLMSDNSIFYYNVKEAHSYKSIVVSEHPAYIENVLLSSNNLSVETMTPAEYMEALPSGYNLYVFDSFEPKSLPKDGAVWLFGVKAYIEGSGFTYQKTITEEEYISLELRKNSNSLFKRLTNGLIGSEVAVKKYNLYGLMRNFMVLYEYDRQPMIFTGSNDYGNREVVFAFDLHDSNFALQMDYITLSKNLIDYTFPLIMDKSNYICGEKMLINVLPGTKAIRVETPKGNHSYMDTSAVASEYLLSEVGSYNVKILFNNGDEKLFNVYVSLPKKESFDNTIENYMLKGNKEDEGFDGYYDKLTALFIVLALIYIADWMVYCYEQYQLQ